MSIKKIAAKDRAKWEKPKFDQVELDVSNVKTQFSPGTDASAFPFSTSMS